MMWCQKAQQAKAWGFEASREGGKAGERAALLAAEGSAQYNLPRFTNQS